MAVGSQQSARGCRLSETSLPTADSHKVALNTFPNTGQEFLCVFRDIPRVGQKQEINGEPITVVPSLVHDDWNNRVEVQNTFSERRVCTGMVVVECIVGINEVEVSILPFELPCEINYTLAPSVSVHQPAENQRQHTCARGMYQTSLGNLG